MRAVLKREQRGGGGGQDKTRDVHSGIVSVLLRG